MQETLKEKPLYEFTGCKLEIDGREVVLIYTPFSHIPESERMLIEDVLKRLEQKQPVILVYVRFDEATLRVVQPAEWKHSIESKALPGSVLKKLPIFERDLPPKMDKTKEVHERNEAVPWSCNQSFKSPHIWDKIKISKPKNQNSPKRNGLFS